MPSLIRATAGDCLLFVDPASCRLGERRAIQLAALYCYLASQGNEGAQTAGAGSTQTCHEFITSSVGKIAAAGATEATWPFSLFPLAGKRI
jgi:hypothetical protein